MMDDEPDYIAQAVTIITELKLQPIGRTPDGLDYFVPVIERMRSVGIVTIIKFDGGRVGENVNGPYTVAVSGAVLGDDYARVDSHFLLNAVAFGVVHCRKYLLPE